MLRIVLRRTGETIFTSNDTTVTLHFYRPLVVPDGDPANMRSAITHFYQKLVLIEESLKTEHGKELGSKRHKFVCLLRVFLLCTNYLILQMIQFLNEVGDEVLASKSH